MLWHDGMTRTRGPQPGAVAAAFDALSFSRRKELARSVSEAKRPETRERRIAAVRDALASH